MSKLLRAGQFDFGDVEILQAGGVSISLIDQIQQITIYEDLFSPFMSGNIIIRDTLSLPTILMNAGVDMLRLRIGTPSLPKNKYINRYFHIYKLSDRIVINERASEFMIHFISTESLVDSSIAISKTFKGKAEDNISDILTKIIKTKVPFNASSTTNEINYTSNLWAPIKNIAYNCDLANHATHGPSMTFYENREGFNFKSIHELGAAEPIMKFESSNHISDISDGDMDSGTVKKNFDRDYKNILSITAPVYYDYMKDKNNAMLSSRLFTFDLTSKKITDVTYNLQQDTNKHMNPNRFYKDSVIGTSYQGSDSNIVMPPMIKHQNLYTDKGDVSAMRFKQKRVSMLRHMQQHKIEITVFGRSDYTVGQTVHVNVNKLLAFSRGITSKQIEDPMLSGKYLVSAICHMFTKEGKHEAILELIRDSVGKSK